MSETNPVNPNEPIAVVRGPIDAAVKRTLPATLGNEVANPMPALMASNTRLAANLDALAKAVEPNPPEKMTITDYVHLATNNRVQCLALGKELEKLVRAVTGGPLNVKLAMELAAERKLFDVAGQDATFDEFCQRLAGVLTGIESRNFSFMDDPATDERVRNCPTNQAARTLLAEVESRAKWIETMNIILGYDNSDGMHSEPDPHTIAKRLIEERAALAADLEKQNARLLEAKQEAESLRTTADGLDKTNGELRAELANKTEVLNAEIQNANRYKAQVDELTKQLDEATKPAGQKARRA